MTSAPNIAHMTAASSAGPLKIFVAAGEVSGDRQAAHLATAIRRLRPDARLFGAGGEFMRDAGVELCAQTSHMGTVGVQESARYLFPLRRVLRDLSALIRSERPDAAVLVDNEGFNNLLARTLRRERVPIIDYFAPQVWLWGRWRATRIARRAAAIIPAFRAEAEIYRAKGANVEWVGHPLLDLVRADTDFGPAFAELGLDPARPLVALMPGSRTHELNQLAAPMFAAARALKQRHPEIQFIVPLAAPHMTPRIEAELKKADLTGHARVIASHVYTCLARCDLVLVAAGTATLEAALLGVPMIVVYRFAAITQALKRCFVHTRFVAMPNILLEEQIVPELTQRDVNATRLTSEALDLLENSRRVDMMRERLRRVALALGSPGAIERAARVVVDLAIRHRNA